MCVFPLRKGKHKGKLFHAGDEITPPGRCQPAGKCPGCAPRAAPRGRKAAVLSCTQPIGQKSGSVYFRQGGHTRDHRRGACPWFLSDGYFTPLPCRSLRRKMFPAPVPGLTFPFVGQQGGYPGGLPLAFGAARRYGAWWTVTAHPAPAASGVAVVVRLVCMA